MIRPSGGKYSLPLDGVELAGQREHRRRLAGAVGPDEGDDLTGVDTQVEVSDDGHLAVARRHAGCFDQRLAHPDTSSAVAS
jgi:hypothetical protein